MPRKPEVKCKKFKDDDGSYVCHSCGSKWGKGTPVEESWRPQSCPERKKK